MKERIKTSKIHWLRKAIDREWHALCREQEGEKREGEEITSTICLVIFLPVRQKLSPSYSLLRFAVNLLGYLCVTD